MGGERANVLLMRHRVQHVQVFRVPNMFRIILSNPTRCGTGGLPESNPFMKAGEAGGKKPFNKF